MRHTIGRWFAAITVGGGLLAAGSPAIAAQAGRPGNEGSPDAVGDESQICLTNAPSYCIKANGAGHQVSITNVAADKANFTVVYDTNGNTRGRTATGTACGKAPAAA